MSDRGKSIQHAGNQKLSAGMLLYCITDGRTEVLLGHPGGPFWKNKDGGSWTIPKGEPEEGENLYAAALRELGEETGWYPETPEARPLTPVKQKAGKWIHAWSAEAFRPAGEMVSNHFEMEWPPRSGRRQTFPEIDRFEWMTIATAKEKINPAQRALLDELEKNLAGS